MDIAGQKGQNGPGAGRRQLQRQPGTSQVMRVHATAKTVPLSLRALIEACLPKNPEHRCTLAQLLTACQASAVCTGSVQAAVALQNRRRDPLADRGRGGRGLFGSLDHRVYAVRA
jgi:hypothetical protein